MASPAPLRIATWNLAHQAGYNGGWGAPASEVAGVVQELDLDIAMFTEFVPSVRPDFPAALAKVGHVSSPFARRW